MLRDGEYDEFNSKFQKLADLVDVAIGTPGLRVTIVIALLGEARIAAQVRRDLDRTVAQLNEPSPLADLEVRGFDDFYRIVESGVTGAKVDLNVRLENYGHLTEPYQAYYGTLPVVDVAEWYTEYGERLFARNIRHSLGLTEVNHQLRTTLHDEPEHFWYFNNGITVLCKGLEKTYRGSSTLAGDFHLTGVSVVNGAQTVKSIHEAQRIDAEKSKAGRVWVRLISLQDCPPDFDNSITQATNTQNQVEARDFVSLDENQIRLRRDFALSLQKTYVVKRGEPDPEPENGCSVVEAARALACAQPDASFAARAKQDSAVLWETGPQGTYKALFNSRLTAHRTWRSVLLYREIVGHLQAEADDREGRAGLVATHGDLLVAHLVFQQLDLKDADDPDVDWPDRLSMAVDLIGGTLDWLTHHVETAYGGGFIPSVFRDSQRCITLASLVLQSIDAGGDAPETSEPEQDTRQRRTNAVIVLVDSGRIADGAALEFRPGTGPERVALSPWLAEDPRRAQATWVNNRGAPLLWAADGRRYSPSGLAKHMLRQVGVATKAVQGTSRWYLPGEGSLVQLANEVRG
nr:AIPR family protein [Kribbella shirazensis]